MTSQSNGTSSKIQEKSTAKRDPSLHKPMIPKSFIKEIVFSLYGMKVVDWSELNSYDDRNYRIHVAADVTNPYIEVVNSEGYVLKVMNSNDSKNPAVLDAQMELLQYLQRKGLPVQEPIITLQGKTWSLQTVPDEHIPDKMNGPYLFYLLNYIEGEIVVNKPYHPTTLYNIGVFAGKFHKAMQGFEHQLFKERTRGFVWSLTELAMLSQYTIGVKDKDNLELVTTVMKAFQNEVVSKYNELTEGYIHGDINEQNIIVQETTDDHATTDYYPCDTTAFIDFADVTYSYPVFDIAILIAYMSLDCKVMDQLDAGGHVLAGYLTEMRLNDAEFDVLRVCICSRLVQSVVMGAYSYYMEPSNTYVLATAKRGWPLLRKYWQTSQTELRSRWNTILNSYNTGN